MCINNVLSRYMTLFDFKKFISPVIEARVYFAHSFAVKYISNNKNRFKKHYLSVSYFGMFYENRCNRFG